jgi:hypothetical protein
MWFNAKDIIIQDNINVPDLHGYVLPHAGTEFTCGIISHTLRFRPTKNFNKVIILYYPASAKPDIDGTYYHEYYVPWKSLETVFGTKGIHYEGYNCRDNKNSPLSSSSASDLIVVSADFSHFLPFNEAIELENKAAHALMFRRMNDNNAYANAVDDVASFQVLYDSIPSNWLLQWVGRTRSSGSKAVGYLSFLLREKPKRIESASADGIFVTAFSKKMTTRECLGEWFDKTKKWSPMVEQRLIDKVVNLSKTTSRLTGGTELDVPVTNYTVTYLFKEKKDTAFIRGWHGLLYNAFYLPEVFLENTFENGQWIQPTALEWPPISTARTAFDLSETLHQLTIKAAGLSGGDARSTFKRRRSSRSRSKSTLKRKHRCKRNYKCSSKGGTKKEILLFSSSVDHFTL